MSFKKVNVGFYKFKVNRKEIYVIKTYILFLAPRTRYEGVRNQDGNDTG